ncbi:MAG TPA: serine hydrolase [bacterium]|nr:serine hydrolase [bacterium]
MLISQKRLAVVLILSLLWSSGYLKAQTTADTIDEYMQYCYENDLFNGSVLVAESGSVIYKQGFGLADMEWEIRNTPATRFRLGSITKQFTSMLIMQLVEHGELDVRDPLTMHLPWYREDTGSQVTIHQLLTHTSGIPSYTSLPNFTEDISRNPYEVKEFIQKYCSGDLEFEPGSQFRYNNSGYFILGAVIEEITGQTYEQVLREKIFGPVGMKHSGYDHHATILPRRAEGYEWNLGEHKNATFLNMSLPYAAGALYSTVEDLYLWDRALYGNRLLGEQYQDMLFSPHIQRANNYYGYAWFIDHIPLADSQDSVKVIEHGGSINGFNTLLSRVVTDEHLIVLLNNTSGTTLGNFRDQIVNILYDKPYQLPKIPVHLMIGDVLAEHGVDAAIERYNEVKDSTSGKYLFNEYFLNTLGYQLMNANRLEDAIKILQLNAEEYPNSANVYDSLGEAYMKYGEKDKAVEYYARSLQINPQNANAVRMLQRIQEMR